MSESAIDPFSQVADATVPAAETAAITPTGVESVPGSTQGSAAQRIRRRDSLFRRALAIADLIAVTAALVAAMEVTGNQPHAAIVLVLPAFVLLAKAVGLYDRDEHLLHRTTLDEVPSLFAIATVGTLLVWLAGDWLAAEELGRPAVLLMWALLFLMLICLRAIARPLARHGSPVERCLFVGSQNHAEELREKLAQSSSVRAELVGWVPVTGRRGVDSPEAALKLPEKITAMVMDHQIERVVAGPGIPEELLDEIRQLRGGVKVSVLPDLRRVVTASVELDWLNGITLVGLPPFALTASSRFIKRAFDLVGSGLALILAAPLMAIVAIAVRLDSPGPVLFRQDRAGRHGDSFAMLKFRSMVDGAHELQESLRHLNEADGVFKIAKDPRVTRVGRVIRRTHVDELPQLVNVLRGHMSLVGPRPLPLEEDRKIEGWHRRRLELRPGITGPWQVLGSARVPVREMVKLDYQYVANWSLWNDIRLLILTAGRILRGGGS